MRPSLRRLAQYRADVTAILLVAHDFLLSLVPSLASLFAPGHNPGSSFVARSIHTKCTILVTALAVVGCSVKVLARSCEEIFKSGAGNPPESGGRLQPLDRVRNNQSMISRP